MPDAAPMGRQVLDETTVQVGEQLVRLAGERPELLAVAGNDPGPLAWFSQIWPERTITVQPGATRLSLAQGITRGGGQAVVVLDDQVTVMADVHRTPVLMISTDPSHCRDAYRAGVTVCQAGWPRDLTTLLVGALDAREPVLVVLHEPLAGWDAPIPATPAAFGEPRILQRGRQGLLVGSGPTSPVAVALAEHLSGRQVTLTTVDSHTVTPDSGVDPTVLSTHVLVGPLTAPRAGALTAVEVTDLAGTAHAIREVMGL